MIGQALLARCVPLSTRSPLTNQNSMTCFAGIDVSPRSVSMCIEDRHVHAVCVRGVPIEYFPGSVVAVETDMTNIGTRTHTIVAVAESMSVPVHRVLARLGDSACPVSASLGAQWEANDLTSSTRPA